MNEQSGAPVAVLEAGGTEAKPAADGHTHEAACLNCGTPLVGSHCHACGQRGHVHRTLGAFFHDLLHGVLHFEGRTWRTLPLLVWNPGKLTREYIDGRRVSYVSPVAVFLFVVFLSYALFSALGGADAFKPNVSGVEQAKVAYESNEKQLADLRLERARLAGDAEEVARIDEEVGEIQRDQQAMRLVLGSVGSNFEENFKAGFEANPLPKGNPITKAIEHVQANPQLAIYKAQTSAYKYSWMLIPLSVPFVWLLFPFSRRFGGYDHTVFATYSISFMIALVAVASLLIFFNLTSVGLLLLLYAPWHMYRQLRGTYALGRFGAIWRMLVLSLFAWVAIGLFAAVIGAMVA
ncbi:DUF3667 domain-containing protein [Croceibacterium sp. LX-88]|uniref:DUF3667 domain-containing protein n=1 Tax=Croceibacterium selenioxidans TaxID=2838833 RepID=A0ABS5W5M3_9SPHN|nr:DUF3667 domain-containing protein [Croceibacterium selenioxidans]MBT2134999.1 DUF3667 domain-containing protein [Croceibacterium selenioxidans]